MYTRCSPKVVVPPVQLLADADVEPRADGVDVSEASRAIVVLNQQLLWDVLVVVQAHDHVHGRVVTTHEALWVEAADVPHHGQHLSSFVLVPMLEQEVHHGDLGVDAVEGLEAVVGLLVMLDSERVAVMVDLAHGDDLVPLLRRGKPHDPNALCRRNQVEGWGTARLLHSLADEEVRHMNRLSQVDVGEAPRFIVVTNAHMGLHHGMPGARWARWWSDMKFRGVWPGVGRGSSVGRHCGELFAVVTLVTRAEAGRAFYRVTALRDQVIRG